MREELLSVIFASISESEYTLIRSTLAQTNTGFGMRGQALPIRMPHCDFSARKESQGLSSSGILPHGARTARRFAAGNYSVTPYVTIVSNGVVGERDMN